MLSDPITLYKLMILYMLAHVNFPLTNSQLTDFFLDHEYTTYFTLQQALNELREAGLLRMDTLKPDRCEIRGENFHWHGVGTHLRMWEIHSRQSQFRII